MTFHLDFLFPRKIFHVGLRYWVDHSNPRARVSSVQVPILAIRFLMHERKPQNQLSGALHISTGFWEPCTRHFELDPRS